MKYIVIEGIDGSGSTTHTIELARRLRKVGKQVFDTHEPTDSPIGALVRQFFEGKHGDLPPWRAMMHLFQADREVLMLEIEAQLSLGRTVVSDRNFLSTFIYQTASAGLVGEADAAEELIQACNIHTLVPALTIILEVPLEVAIERRRSRAVTAVTEDHYERRLAFMQAVHEGYAEVQAASIVRVNANREKEVVADEVFSLVSGLLG